MGARRTRFERALAKAIQVVANIMGTIKEHREAPAKAKAAMEESNAKVQVLRAKVREASLRCRANAADGLGLGQEAEAIRASYIDPRLAGRSPRDPKTPVELAVGVGVSSGSGGTGSAAALAAAAAMELHAHDHMLFQDLGLAGDGGGAARPWMAPRNSTRHLLTA